MKLFVSIVSLFISSSLIGQDLQLFKIGKKDSIQLLKSWKQFKNALETKNQEALKSISLKRVECLNCVDWDSINTDNSKVSIDTFINKIFRSLDGSELFKEIKKNKHSLRAIRYSKNSPVFYEVIFSFKPNGYSEGFTFFFQFIKVSSRFVFYGEETIP